MFLGLVEVYVLEDSGEDDPVLVGWEPLEEMKMPLERQLQE